MAKDSKKIVSEFSKELLKKIGIKADVDVTEEADTLKVAIGGDNLGALIGYHGETLESLQLLLSLMLNNKLEEGDWKRVVLDIGNWRSERLATLETMIEKSVSELKAQGLTRVSLPPMSASQRREVHVIVTEKYPELLTESEGNEPERRVVLYTKP